MSGTYARKLLRVNLSTGEIKTEEIPDKLLRDYIGGRGLGAYLLSRELPPEADPLGPENVLVFATGPLTGTPAPTGGRYMVLGKSPLTGLIASSNSGGHFGAELKAAGFDLVVLESRASEPVYLSIKDGQAELKPADHLWGLDTHETVSRLLEDFGDPGAKVACIGPAGENLVRFACIINDRHRAAGRSGVGAIMGAKRLKAIVVRGHKRYQAPEEKVFMDFVRQKTDILRRDPITGEGLPKLGTKVLDSIINAHGLYPTRNFQTGVFEATEEVSGEALVEKGYLKKNRGCYACPIRCGRVTELPTGHKGEGPEYESGWSLGACCGVKDLIAITEANYLCNRLGLDTISCGVTIACAMELYEKGHLPKEDLAGGPELRFGSSEAIIYYTHALARRQGLGDRLAEGALRLAQAYGHPELAMVVKGQELPAYDPRGAQGHALQYATSNRGGCHVRGYLIAPEILGVPEKLDPQETAGKAQWVKIFQDLTAVIDSTGLCLFTSFALGAEDYAQLLSAATGFNYTVEEMLLCGERIWNLERLFNLKAGLDPSKDTLPDRFLQEPLPEGPQKGAVVRLSEMLPEYYRERGWDPSGRPTEEKLRELGLI
ncbi:aldehyde ferredoxin oxidoreductase family protein [Thermosulfuriphilus ammonigenes]|uniref:Aldehyde ferredoxin oxidoreductase family protein n=1 Tax=Thermosulfuriphilus ammonigenes TaxID=1936021 RepID=A0A6G7PUI1_9BACT|nr:aldehyde ferredoxin oxidoreductase family protein [Thermosulfuriphilus ammonigenes]MBA2848773.1 aldehyde:ferredoxin oxidoreductase [Thermosulfuriphilus ammonigenes]QIJ71098.1 aldehyde ferredoxin oxidoreductase family protein [Thermosulfuriphilus ammonigenes]